MLLFPRVAAALAILAGSRCSGEQQGFGVQPADIRVGCVYGATSPCTGRSWRRNVSQVVAQNDAQFLVFHFAWLRLPPGARLAIRDAAHDGRVLHVHGENSAFFTPPLFSRSAVIEYVVPEDAYDVEADYYGFHIDEYRFAALSVARWASPTQPTRRKRGHHHNDTLTIDRHGDGKSPYRTATGNEVQCVGTVDYSVPAACTRFIPDVFDKSHAVARLLVHKVGGSVFCTGWLFGCEGHVMTNNHCVSSPAEADSTAIEFLAQGEECNQDCDMPMGCPGVVETTSSEIVATSTTVELDFTLLLPRLPDQQRRNLTANYGFLSMRSLGPMLDERIFIPQHPAGFGKHVAVKFDSSYGSIVTLTDPGCNGLQSSTGYQLNSKGGSSGAPVIADVDKSVVGLHYCGGCLSSAIPSHLILQALDTAAALPQCGRV